MHSLFRGANELKIGSSILTRRGGTDANAPESPRKPINILRDWHVGILAPQFLENPLNVPKIIPVNMNTYFYGTRIGRNEQRMHRSG